MTPRTLLTIIIKIIGIYLVASTLTLIPETFSFILETISFGGFSQISTLEFVFFLGLTIGAYILIFRYFLFKTDWLIDKFHLDKGFTEEKIEINVHRSTVLRIAVVVIGMVVIIDSLPLLLKQTFSYFQMSSNNRGFGLNNIASGWMIYYFAKFVFGFFLVTSSRLVVNIIELKRKKPSSPEPLK